MQPGKSKAILTLKFLFDINPSVKNDTKTSASEQITKTAVSRLLALIYWVVGRIS